MGFSDIVHGVLDVAGFIPVVGVVADVANAVIYAAEGDWGNAALSAVSAIPVVGDAVGAIGKSAKLVAKGSKALEWAVSKAKKMSSFFGMLSGKAKTGAKKIWNKINRKKKSKKAKKAAKRNAAQNKCFTGDTLVCTNYGFCPIKEIRKGYDIYSRNETTGETGLRKVQEVVRNEAHTIYHIWLDSREEIKTTAYHPVFVNKRGWVSAINLREGNLVETMEGLARITKIVKMRHEEPVEVYNFHVEEWETYFISKRRLYVHNCKGSNEDTIKGVENGDIPLTNSMHKGNYGEMKMDEYFESQGYERISLDKVTDLKGSTHQGIDGVYYNSNGHPPYIIGEAKYGSSKLGKTQDGMQMSDTWIKGSNRLENAVGKDIADDMLLEGYGKKLVRIAPDGKVSVTDLN